MTLQTYLWCFIAGLLGIGLHIWAVKLPNIKAQAKVGNIPFSYSKYFQDDLPAILSSAITVAIFLVILDELVAFKPAVIPFLKAGFIFVGFTGSSILIALLGKASKRVNNIVDAKTDIADGK